MYPKELFFLKIDNQGLVLGLPPKIIHSSILVLKLANLINLIYNKVLFQLINHIRNHHIDYQIKVSLK